MVRVLVIIAFLAAWFLPLIIAALYKLPHQGPIAVLSLALGWTGVGWLAALVITIGGAIRATRPALAGQAQPQAAGPGQSYAAQAAGAAQSVRAGPGGVAVEFRGHSLVPRGPRAASGRAVPEGRTGPAGGAVPAGRAVSRRHPVSRGRPAAGAGAGPRAGPVTRAPPITLAGQPALTAAF